jgi:hypothetical protein
MACNFAQLILYRPFLPYLRIMAEGKAIPLAQSRHALACIKLASTTILRLDQSVSATPEAALSWDTTYTLFLAIMCLVFLISAHNGTAHPSEAWQRCEVGIRLLTRNACMSNGAATCLRMLEEVVRQLNHTVDFDFDHISESSSRICAQSSINARGSPQVGNIDAWPSLAERPKPATLVDWDTSLLANDRQMDADTMLAHAEDLAVGIDFDTVLHNGFDDAEHAFTTVNPTGTPD